MMAHGTRQHTPFDIAPLADEIVGRIAVGDVFNVLIDDRALVEVAGPRNGRSQPISLTPRSWA